MTLLAAYAFSEGSGNTAADATGNGNTANLSGVTDWTADGHTGSAWSNLIGQGAYGIIPMAGLTFTNAATVEAWVYRENWGETNRRAFGAANAAGTSDGLVVGAAGGTARPLFIVTTTTGYHFIYSDSSWGTLPAGWHHLAGVYDGAEIRVYIDGTLAGTKTGVTGNLDLSTTLGFDIGRNASRTSGYLVGHLDDLRIYNHALSVAEIQTDMNTPVGQAAPTTTPVTATVATAWSSSSRVAATMPTAWDARTRVGAQAPSGWDTRQRVAAGVTSSWSVKARVSTTRASAWDVTGAPSRVAAEVTSTWDVRTAVLATVGSAWQARQRVTTTQASAWAVLEHLERVQATTAASWALRARLAAHLTAGWDIEAAPVITIKVSAGPAGRNLAPASVGGRGLLVDGPRR